MEIAREIKDAENALKEFTAGVLKRQFGHDWLYMCGLEQTKIEKWFLLKHEVESSNGLNQHKEQPVFYAPLKDISYLIKTHWVNEFNSVFGDLDLITAYIKILHHFRNPDKARRELFIHEKHLILGVTGDIRNRIASYRSYLELGKPGFPRIESVKDNFGNVWTYGNPTRFATKTTLKVGDMLEFVITAIDPEQGALQYRILGFKWETGNILRLPIDDKLIGASSKINITIRSGRKHHAFPLGYDDRVAFQYQILPA